MSPPLALASVAHADDPAHLEPAQRPRAKAISRPERIVAARVFSTACEASGLSDRVIGRWLGVDESIVRRMRHGDKPVSLETLLRVPPAVESGVSVALEEHAKSRSLVTR